MLSQGSLSHIDFYNAFDGFCLFFIYRQLLVLSLKAIFHVQNITFSSSAKGHRPNYCIIVEVVLHHLLSQGRRPNYDAFFLFFISCCPRDAVPIIIVWVLPNVCWLHVPNIMYTMALIKCKWFDSILTNHLVMPNGGHGTYKCCL